MGLLRKKVLIDKFVQKNNKKIIFTVEKDMFFFTIVVSFTNETFL